MGIQFANAAEALAGVTAIVVAADNQGSLKERQFLFDHVAPLEPFAGIDPAGFNALLGTITGRIYDQLPTDPSTMQFTPAAMDELFLAVKQQLTPAQCVDAVRIAEALVSSDQATPGENALVAQMKTVLGVA